MRKLGKVIVVLAFLAGLWPLAPKPLLAGSDPKVLVNEFYRGGTLSTGDEWIELVIAQDLTATQLEGFSVGDSTSTTAAKYSGYRFTNMSSIAANFPKGTIIVIGGTAAFTEDTSYDPANGDWSFFLHTSAGSYLASNGYSGNLAGTDVVYVDTDGTYGDATLSADGFAVNWDSTPGTFGGVADVTISGPSNNTGVVLTSGVAGATNSANWSTSVAAGSLTPGNPNGGANSTYVMNLRSALGAQLTIDKSAPTEVRIGDVFTYTLVTSNGTGGALTNVAITDSLPLSATVLSVSDGGVILTGNVVSWTVASLADGAKVTRTVNVASPGVNTSLVNADYRAASPDWATPAVGAAVTTTVGGELVTIAAGRGMTDAVVTLAGRATMYTGGFYAGSGNAKFYVQDATGGIAVQCFGSNGQLPEVTLGDLVTVTGRIGAYHSEVQIVPHDNVADVTVVDGAPADVPAPVDVALADFNSPNTPAWLSRVQGQAVRVHADTYYAVDISDGVDTVRVYVDKNTNINMDDIQAYSYYEVTGIAEAHYSDFELKPRIQADFVEITPAALLVHKEAPGLVVSGTAYSYTIVATNNTTGTLNNLIITDTVPVTNAVVAQVLDGGVLAGNTITWTAATLPISGTFTAHFVMTATGTAGATITNTDYAAWADEWTVPARGPAVETKITSGCDAGDTPIYSIQGSGDASPLVGSQRTICGVVTGVSAGLKGFFLQDPDGDGDTATSDGIFVYRSSQPFSFLQVGDLVEVHGQVDEYYGLTRLRSTHSSDALTVMAEDYPSPVAEALNPPADRAAADTYLETVEGMLVGVPVTVTVVGPTNHFGEYYVVRGDTGVTRLVRNTNPPDGYRLGVDDGLTLSDDYVVGDVLSGLYGPLHYTYNNWKIEQAYQPTVVSLVDVPDTLPQYPPAETYGVTTGAFNVLNFDGLDDAVKLTKVVSSIIAMGPPTFLSLEEIAVVDTWHYFDNYTVTGVIEDVLGGLAAAGYSYDYAYSHADGGGHGVAVLYDTDVVQLGGVETLQGCSSVGSGSASNYDHFCDAGSDNPLFSRRPVVVTGTLHATVPPTQITFIGAHLKSGFGDPDDVQRRLEQAQLIAGYVSDLLAAGQEHVIVAGDMNDFVGSQTLTALETTGTLTDTFYTLPPEARYSYVYNGGSQVLDHILVSPALFATLDDFQPLHIDADYPAAWEIDADEVFGVSDHDPVAATFALEEPAVVTIDKEIVGRSGGGSGTLLYDNGMVTYTITLSNTSAVDALNVQLEDALPAQLLFDAWVENAAGAVEAGNTITWTGTVSATTQVAFTFRATVLPYDGTILLPVVNTATFTADNALGGADSATFDLGVWQKIFLPLVMNTFNP